MDMEHKMKTKRKKIVVGVSGPFDPIHVGHIEYLQKARKLGDELIVLLNNDNWLVAKKGYCFMPEKDRKKIVEALACVDYVRISKHKPGTIDWSSIEGLIAVRPDIFANGGERKKGNTPETEYCKANGIKMIFGVGRKLRSSSDLVKQATKHYMETDQEGLRQNYEKTGYGTEGFMEMNKKIKIKKGK